MNKNMRTKIEIRKDKDEINTDIKRGRRETVFDPNPFHNQTKTKINECEV